MKNFDTSRHSRKPNREERTFVIGGETFVLQSGIHPSVLEAYDDITPDATIKRTLEVVDELIVNMIEDENDAAERYAAVRERRDDPVTIEDLQELVEWMVSMQAARPTGSPGVSSPGPTRTGTPSKAGSSSPGVKAA